MLRQTPIKFFIAAILGMGALRFALDLAGVSDSLVKLASMSAVILVGAIYFALTLASRKDRLKAAYLLIFPYMIVEVAALLYTWISGRDTIFHTPDYSFNTTIGVHTIGHFIGGLTWEPLMVFAFMEIVCAVQRWGRRAKKPNQGVA